ncbi:thiamine pyrophosphate-binding protein [Xylophilus sp. Kf1]|nr:thiamine pyrophosphate-binding protein [Xylophilus sp. Kf1]
MRTTVGEQVGVALGRLGVRRAFGVVGSGNFHFTNGMVRAGVDFVAARHEGGAATMADAHARMSGEVGVLSLHQGCGLTNAMTGIGEAAKSRTPLLVVTGESTDPASNFHIDQDMLVRAVGAVSLRIRSAASALADLRAAFDLALHDRRTVVLNLPLDIQAQPLEDDPARTPPPVLRRAAPQAAPDAVRAFAELLKAARRPVFIAGRGARGVAARDALLALADDVGALLAEGAVAKGLFGRRPWAIDVAGGFSSPLTAELIAGADLVVGWGSVLNNWTTGHGRLLGPQVRLVQVDLDTAAIGRHRPVTLGLVGDVAATAAATSAMLRAEGYRGEGYRSAALAERIGQRVLWRDTPYQDTGTDARIDPRTLSTALDDLLPKERVVAVDSGNFMGYPSMYLGVPDENAFCFTQAFQSIGLGLSTAIGAALAQPGRFPVAACGDGGFLMGISELETAVRLRLGMLIVVYNDAAYGAEVYYFQPAGHPTGTVEFPDSDIAAIARGYGADGLTVRTPADLPAVAERVARGLTRPLVVDAKIVGASAWWHQAAMKGH